MRRVRRLVALIAAISILGIVTRPRSAAAAIHGTSAGCAVQERATAGALRPGTASSPTAGLVAGACEPARLLAPHPLAMITAHYGVIGKAPLVVRLTTASYAQVLVTLSVRNASGLMLYRTHLAGRADGQGRFAGLLRIAYVPSVPMPAELTVSARTPTASAVYTFDTLIAH